MKNTLWIIGVASALFACGGGADEGQLSARSAEVLLASDKRATGALPADLPGDSDARSIGQLQNGGHVVAWVSELDAYIQRYNKTGKTAGKTTMLAVPHDLPDYMSPPTVVVQANGEVAVAYQRVRTPAAIDPVMALQQQIGVYLQRFAANGAPLQGESEIVSMLRYVPGARQELQELRSLALSDGGFVVSWGVGYRGGLGATQTDYFMQRFDSSGATASDIIAPVKNYWCANRYANSTFEWEADDRGGFSVSGTIHPKQFDGEDACSGYGPPVERQVVTYYPGAEVPSASKRAKREACMEGAHGLRGQERKLFIDSCLAA